MEPVAPWVRDLNRLFTSEGNAFVPPADVMVTDDGVTVYMDLIAGRPNRYVRRDGDFGLVEPP